MCEENGPSLSMVSFVAVRIILYMLYNLIGLIIVLVKET